MSKRGGDKVGYSEADIKGYCDHIHGMSLFYDQMLEASKNTPEDCFFLEIGSWKGGSAVAMMQALRDGKKQWLITVDPYGTKPFKLGNTIQKAAQYDEDIYRDAMWKMSSFARDNKLNHTHFRMTSDDFMKTFEQIDFWHKGEIVKPIKFGGVFIDGDHESYTVNRELDWLVDRMAQGGLIVFDDIPYVAANDQPLINLALAQGKQDNCRCYWNV